MRPIRKHLSFANIVSCLALFVALGGASYAAVNLPKNSVGPRQLKPKAVKTGYLDRNAVKTGKLAPEAARAGKIAKNAITTDRLRNSAVTGQKVLDGSLLANDFAPGQIPAGPQGPPGPAGATNVTVRTKLGPLVEPGNIGTVSVNCADGERATGGGWSFSQGTFLATLVETSRPLVDKATGVPDGWHLRYWNDGGGIDMRLTVQVICASP